MSELKAYAALISELNPTPVQIVYLKSEADKVIAELNARITPKQSDKTLQEQLNEVCKKHGVSTLQDLDWAFCESEKRRTKDNIDAINIIYHHKYKRCLAMAKWCESKVYHIRRTPLCDMSEHEYWQYENDFWQRWQKRWLELAKKFKEAK